MAIRRKVEHLIDNKDGTIAKRNSDGSDPRRRQGQVNRLRSPNA
jgi:hypothetical protein